MGRPIRVPPRLAKLPDEWLAEVPPLPDWLLEKGIKGPLTPEEQESWEWHMQQRRDKLRELRLRYAREYDQTIEP